ncbi:hypothetical protein Scep_017800 [Stephania cephalantha]|uniref:DNA repair protein UVH3 n=1 Tax=Stephania cephalantha TaxID=152367 RepID=A0AAP0NTZ0_9MAGN
MGVHGLWELLAPVGRRVSVETLAGKRLAIDASIWMVQFMKAMRDERGDMIRNAHVLGFFRRICKLLFLRTKPVFVFDGGTPALKRRTVIARRRQRENAQAKIRKTAEKLLLNHLKAMRLKELAKDIENQRQMNDKKGKSVVLESGEVAKNASEMSDKVTGEFEQETIDAMLAASLAAEEGVDLTASASTVADGGIVREEEEEMDEDEEMVLPAMHGKVDPAILAALPPSMQLDLLVQMRERLMAENRQKYQKVKKAPEKFSELQIQSYLKTVAFRREIDEVQKSAAGKGVAGVQISRIASEANREFIFSSSFSGDRRTLTSGTVEETAEVEKNKDSACGILEKGKKSSDNVNYIPSAAQPTSVAGSEVDEPTSSLGDDVGTYVDERGRLRVSRVRAMGICMTRDIQRNLDFLKELELDKLKESHSTDTEAILDKIASVGIENIPANSAGIDKCKKLDIGTDELVQIENSTVPEKRTALEISFIDNDNGQGSTDDDELFTQLAAGSSVIYSMPSSINNFSAKHSEGTSSEYSWEEEVVEEKGSKITNDCEEQTKVPLMNENLSENELDWEDGALDVSDTVSLSPTVQERTLSRGSLQEEAEIQEAIRRSLEDLTHTESTKSNKKGSVETTRDMDNDDKVIAVLMPEKDRIDLFNLPGENGVVLSQESLDAASGLTKADHLYGSKDPLIHDPKEKQLALSKEHEVEHHEKDMLRHESSNVGISGAGGLKQRNGSPEKPSIDSSGADRQMGIHFTADEGVASSKDNEDGNDGNEKTCSARNTSHVPAAVMVEDKAYEVSNAGTDEHDFVAGTECYLFEASEDSNDQEEPLAKRIDGDLVREPVREESFLMSNKDRKESEESTAGQEKINVQMMVSEVSLDEKLMFLREERESLGDEQRKLERNAESVSSEMFAECQELLQMFGLPYIIAPMEAEAQCAFMEVEKLVDGVVTDDSDVFLFGARNVFKNIFDDRKYVETYFMKDIESELGLTREKLIRMALLLGSDYTEGVSGIGIVNAIEVVNAFPEENGLQNFREWLESPDPTILGKLNGQTGSASRKRGSKINNGEGSNFENNVEGSSSSGGFAEGHNDKQSKDNVESIKQIFMDKHRNVSKNWHIPSSFPSEAVISAYVSPRVDKSKETFSWGKPDLFILRKLCWEKFGWSNKKADELLMPVLKEYSKHETQLRLEAFYTFNERFAKIRSQRIRKAVKGITGKHSLETDELSQEVSKSKKKRKVGISGSEKPGTGGSEIDILEKSSLKQSRKRKTSSEALPSEENNSEPSVPQENQRNTTKGSSRSLRSGRGRGRGRGKTSGRRKRIVSNHESSECSSSDGSDDDGEQEHIQVKKTEIFSKVRRSTRPRKQVKYAVNESEASSSSNSSDHNDGNFVEEAAVEAVLNATTSGDAANDTCKKDMDPLQDVNSCEGYLESGGGFCLEEGEQETEPVETVHCTARASNGNSHEDVLATGYLKIGGGFCLEDDEPEADQVPSFSGHQTEPSELLNGAISDVSGATRNPNSHDKESNHDERDAEPQPTSEETPKVDYGTVAATTGLTAMPLLRRKRRKS